MAGPGASGRSGARTSLMALPAPCSGHRGPSGPQQISAHCHVGLGQLYGRTGKDEQAQEHLTTAATMYREMDMRFWLEQAEAELGELR